MQNYYSWIKAFHVISIIAWMAGMLYLPRLMVYHANATSGSQLYETLKIMQARLIKYIINPAMLSSIILGSMNAFIYGIKNIGVWFHIKMVAVFGLLALHGMLIKFHKNFLKNTNTHNATFFKIINESITVLMIVCVIMVIIKPFE